MNLTRLEHHQHPRPPHHELRQKIVFDSAARSIGQVANLYFDGDRNLLFLDVCMSGFMGFGKKHHLVPAEAIAEESPGAVTLRVDQQAVEGAPTLANPHAGPDEELQRAARENKVLGRYFSRELRRKTGHPTRVEVRPSPGRPPRRSTRPAGPSGPA